jgi:hypothetical protein
MTRENSGAAAAALRYTLPGASGTIWLGLPLSSLGGLTVTVTTVVLLLLAGAPVWSAALLAAAGAGLSAWPIAGRSVLGWLPLGSRHALARLTGGDRWTRPWPTSNTSGRAAWAPLDLGVGPRRLRVADLGGSATVGAVQHHRSGRVTVVLEVIGAGRFGLLDPAAQDSGLARWGSGLATLLADPSVSAVQWLTHTRPDTRPCGAPPTATRADTSDASDGSAETMNAKELAADYQQLLADVRADAVQHRHLLALTFTRGHAAARTRADEGQHPPDVAVLTGVRQAATALLAADLLARPLTAAELHHQLRLLLDPALPEHGPAEELPDPGSCGALSMRSEWQRCRTDDTWHRCYAVSGWPRLALPADWLAPLLHDIPPAATSRTLSVHARPVAPELAARRARAAVAKARLDAADRGRLGFVPAAADMFAETDAATTEAELVAGYRMAELSAVVAVSAPDEPLLEQACRQLRALATGQRLDLRPLHGQHSQALAAALPLGLHPGAPV